MTDQPHSLLLERAPGSVRARPGPSGQRNPRGQAAADASRAPVIRVAYLVVRPPPSDAPEPSWQSRAVHVEAEAAPLHRIIGIAADLNLGADSERVTEVQCLMANWSTQPAHKHSC